MKQGDSANLIKEESDRNLNRSIIKKVKNLIHCTDIEYVVSNCIGKIGSPVVYEMNVKAGDTANYKINYNEHDFKDIYHLWFIVNQLNHLEEDRPIICEIGFGYGGSASKIKINIKNLR